MSYNISIFFEELWLFYVLKFLRTMAQNISYLQWHAFVFLGPKTILFPDISLRMLGFFPLLQYDKIALSDTFFTYILASFTYNFLYIYCLSAFLLHRFLPFFFPIVIFFPANDTSRILSCTWGGGDSKSIHPRGKEWQLWQLDHVILSKWTYSNHHNYDSVLNIKDEGRMHSSLYLQCYCFHRFYCPWTV